MKVLIAEDTRAIRMIVAATVANAGHEAIEASNGIEAVEAFKDNGYAGIGWFEDMLAEEEKTNKEKLRTAYELVYPDHKPGRAAQNVSQIYRFLNEVEDGDVVLTPYNDSRMIILS